MAGGLLLATVNPLRSAANKGKCFDDACRETVQVEAGPTAGYALGGAAMVGIGAAVTWWIKPFSLTLDPAKTSASVSLQGSF